MLHNVERWCAYGFVFVTDTSVNCTKHLNSRRFHAVPKMAVQKGALWVKNMSGFDGSSQRTFVDGTVDTMRLTDKPTNSAIRDKLCLKFEKVGPPRTHCSPV